MRDLSAAMREAFFLPETDKIIIALLTIDHSSLPSPIRVCLNRNVVTSNGRTFTPYPFEMALMPETAEAPPSMRLRIDAIDRSIVKALRAAQDEAPTVLFELVLATSPDTIETTLLPMDWRVANYNVHSVEGQIEGPAAFNRRAIKDAFTPTIAPALFAL